MHIKIVKNTDTDWGVQLGPDFFVSGFPSCYEAGRWYAELFARMSQAAASEDMRKQFLGAALLSSVGGPEKKQ